MVEPTKDNRVIRSLSASTREKSPGKKRKKKDNPIDIAFTVKARKPQSKFKIENPKTLSQIDVIRKTAGNIEKASRPKSERKLPGSGKVGTGINYEELPYGGKHKRSFLTAAVRDGLKRGDLDFATGKGKVLGKTMRPQSKQMGKLFKKDTRLPISDNKNPKTGKPYTHLYKKGDLDDRSLHDVNVRSLTKSNIKEVSETTPKHGTRMRMMQDDFLDMSRQNTKADESLSIMYDRTKVDDVLGQFKTGTGKKPKDKRRRKIKVYTTDPNSGF